MKIKRYFAPDMRQAIRKVREEQGPDAAILSNRRVNGGIEIIAAVDYDESLFDAVAPGSRAQRGAAPAAEPTTPSPSASPAPEIREPARPSADVGRTTGQAADWTEDPTLGAMRKEIQTLRSMLENQLSSMAWTDMARENPVRATLMQRFADMGLAEPLSKDLVGQITADEDLEHGWRQGLGLLAHRVPVSDDDILTQGGVVSLVGPTGVGKTTMVAKLAARYALRNGRRHVALVSTDSFRIGAYEQLHTYGQLLGVPVYSASDADELRHVLDDLCDKHLVLIDTAGMGQRDMRLVQQLETLHGGGPGIRTYLVLSANTQTSTLTEVTQAFRQTRLNGCILTKLDEAASLGSALSAVVHAQLPVAYVGDGQRVPEDMHQARAHTLISRAVALMQQSESSMGGEAAAGSNSGNMANAHV